MKKLIFIVAVATFFISCGKEKPKSEASFAEPVSATVETMLNYCYTCHNPNAASHDDLLAPPMAAVKMRYIRSFSEKDAFVEAVSSWSVNPEEKSALMRGAVNNYGVMPKAPFSKEDLEVLAAYLYDNELPEPEWFREHEQQMHGSRGMGRGRGN